MRRVGRSLRQPPYPAAEGDQHASKHWTAGNLDGVVNGGGVLSRWVAPQAATSRGLQT